VSSQLTVGHGGAIRQSRLALRKLVRGLRVSRCAGAHDNVIRVALGGIRANAMNIQFFDRTPAIATYQK
jgi:hypothetical protein